MEKKRISAVDKFFLFFIISFVLFLIYYYKQQEIIAFMQRYYPLWLAYTHIQSQVAQRTLFGLFYASFFGALFFIMLPIEVLFIYYSALPYPVVWVVTVTLIGNLFGLIVNYFMGRIIGLGLVRRLLKERFEKYQRITTKYGGFVIFFGNILIFPIEIITLVIGSAKYPFRRFLVLSAFGKLIKFLLLLLGKEYLQAHVLPHLPSLL